MDRNRKDTRRIPSAEARAVLANCNARIVLRLEDGPSTSELFDRLIPAAPSRSLPPPNPPRKGGFGR